MVSGGQMRTGWQVVITVISLCKIFKLHNLGSSEMEMLSCSWALDFSRYYSTEVQARKQTSAQMKIYYNINLCQYYNSGSQLASNCPVSCLYTQAAPLHNAADAKYHKLQATVGCMREDDFTEWPCFPDTLQPSSFLVLVHQQQSLSDSCSCFHFISSSKHFN